MHVRFWGTRGSIASPGPETTIYGGNTTCIEIRTNDDELIVLDGGTGIFRLGHELTKRKLPKQISVFVTHTHWDHIQGFPFFVPLFIPHQKINFYGTFDPVYDKSLKEILAGQMEYCYYPVRESELKANIDYKSLKDRETVTVGGARVTPIMMNHPVLNFGYLIEADGQKIFFTGDHEPIRNIYNPDEAEYAEFEQIITLRNSVIEDQINEVDIVITDSMYTAQEYPMKIGWGHGSFQSCIEMADRIDAGRLLLTHHEPTRTDSELDGIYDRIKTEYAHVGPELIVAKEGMIIDLG